jgi:hypothetical protein
MPKKGKLRTKKSDRKQLSRKNIKRKQSTTRGGEIHKYNQDSYGRYRGDYGDSNIVGSYKPELPYQVAANFLDGKYALFNETLSDPLNHTGVQIGSHASILDVTNGVNLIKRDTLPVYNPIFNLTTQGKIFNAPISNDYHYRTNIPGFSGGGKKNRRRPISKKVVPRKKRI